MRRPIALFPFALTLAAAALLMMVASARAQPEVKVVLDASTRSQITLQRGPSINLDFRGGKISALIENIRAAAEPSPVNILTNPEVGDQDVPAIRLKGVSVETALRNICNMLVIRGWSADAVSMARDGDTVPTFFLKAFPQHGFSGAPQVEMKVFSVRDLVDPPPGLLGDGLSIEMPALKSAIELVQQQTIASGKPPDAKVHEESRTLIVRGTSGQIEQIDELLDTIKADLTSRRSAAGLMMRDKAARNAQSQELRAKLEVAAATNHAAERALDSAREALRQAEARKGLDIAPLELEQRRQQVIEFEARAVATRAERDRMAAEMNALGADAATPAPTPAEDARLIIYDARDLKPAQKDFEKFLDLMREQGGGRLPRLQVFDPSIDNPTSPSSTNLIIVATPQQHDMIKQILGMLRSVAAPGAVQQKE